jgi:hypothetical protein
MADQELPHRIYIGEPTNKVLLQLEGNILKVKPVLAATETCCSCACGSCSCNCSCNACGSCYCSCSCCGLADKYIEDIFTRIELTNAKMGEMGQILESIRSGLRLEK